MFIGRGWDGKNPDHIKNVSYKMVVCGKGVSYFKTFIWKGWMEKGGI